MAEYVARWLGIDITTTEMALAASDGETDGFSSTSMRGAGCWKEDEAFPGFDLSVVSRMLLELLESMRGQGWRFEDGGSLSVACRQHDMVVLDGQAQPLLPALSWQCNAATRQVEQLNADPEVTTRVGLVEERFILPKLSCVLDAEPGLRDRVARVMTTGDWVLGKLTGQFRLSTSDALSNGLLDQRSRELASTAIRAAGLETDWFPEVLQSGHALGKTADPVEELDSEWKEIRQRLPGWEAVAGLGDNHASALGCGMRDERTMVISAGTSGTVNLALPADASLDVVEDPAARFEFYRDQTLLLRMLAYCGDWYIRFLDEFAADCGGSHGYLNSLAASADLPRIRRVECDRRGEYYRSGWTRLSLAEQIASVQFSIAAELLDHVSRALREVPSARRHLQTYVLTGGLSQSPFFQQVFQSGVHQLDPGKRVRISGKTGPLRYKTSAAGALLNARMPQWKHDLKNLPETLFPLADCAPIDEQTRDTLARKLLTSGLKCGDWGRT